MWIPGFVKNKIGHAVAEEAEKKVSKWSYRTTAWGVAVILLAAGQAATALLDGDPETVPDLKVLGAEFAFGMGLIQARDQKAHKEVSGDGEK